MRTIALSLIFPVSLGYFSIFIARPAQGASNPLDGHYSLKKIRVLRAGKYRCVVPGVLCNACTRAIVLQLKKLKAVEDARFEFEEGFLWITIKKDATVRATKVYRALRHASRIVGLGTRYEIKEILFVK